MKRLIVPALLVAAFLAGGMAPARAGGSSAEYALSSIADSMKEIARRLDRKVEVECSCRCEK